MAKDRPLVIGRHGRCAMIFMTLMFGLMASASVGAIILAISRN